MNEEKAARRTLDEWVGALNTAILSSARDAQLKEYDSILLYEGGRHWEEAGVQAALTAVRDMGSRPVLNNIGTFIQDHMPDVLYPDDIIVRVSPRDDGSQAIIPEYAKIRAEERRRKAEEAVIGTAPDPEGSGQPLPVNAKGEYVDPPGMFTPELVMNNYNAAVQAVAQLSLGLTGMRKQADRVLRDAWRLHGFSIVEPNPPPPGRENECPFVRVRHVHPYNIIHDAGCPGPDLGNARWLAVREFVPIGRLKAEYPVEGEFGFDGKFAAANRASDDWGNKLLPKSTSTGERPNETDVVEVWTVYSKIGFDRPAPGKANSDPEPEPTQNVIFRIILADANSRILSEPDLWPGAFDFDRFPVADCKFLDRPDGSPIGKSPLWAGIDIQKAINWCAKLIQDCARKNIQQIIAVDKSNVSNESELDAIRSGARPVVVLETKGPVEKVLFHIPPPPLPDALVATFSTYLALWYQFTGAIAPGGSTAQTRSAASDVRIAQGQKKKMDSVLAAADDYYLSVVERIVGVARVQLTMKDVEKLIGPRLAEWWIDPETSPAAFKAMRMEMRGGDLSISIAPSAQDRAERNIRKYEQEWFVQQMLPIAQDIARNTGDSSFLRELIRKAAEIKGIDMEARVPPYQVGGASTPKAVGQPSPPRASPSGPEAVNPAT